MRLLTTTALAVLMTFSITTDAEARRGSGTAEKLEFVADTKIPGPGGANLSLCHLVEHNTVLSIPILTSSQGYALATDKCNTDSYFAFEAADFLAAQAGGLIAADIPAEPSIGLARTIWKYTFLGFVGLAFLAAGLMVIRSKMRTRSRRKEMGKASKVALNTLDAMCHVAKADGQIDGDEVGAIAFASEQLTGTAFPAEKIAKMIELSEARLTTKGDFLRFGKGLKPTEFRTVMRGVLMVAAIDGNLAEAEKTFIGNLAAALKISQEEIMDMLGQLSAPAAQTQA